MNRAEPSGLPTAPKLRGYPGPATGAIERLARNGLAIGASTWLSKGVLFLWQLMLARQLGAEGYGVYGTIGALLALGAALPDLGMGLIVIRQVAKDHSQADAYLAATVSLQPPLAAIAWLGCLLLASLLGYAGHLQGLLALAGVGLLIDVFGNMAHNQLLAIERMLLPSAIAVAHAALLLLLTGSVLLAGGGLLELYLAILCASVIRSAAYWVGLMKFGGRPRFPVELPLLRRLVLDGWPLAAAGFLLLGSSHADKLLTTALVGAAGTGLLTAGFVLVFGVIELFNTPLLVVTFPHMAQSFAQGQAEAFHRMVDRLLRVTMVVGLPLVMIVSFSADGLVGVLFGGPFAGAARVLRVLIWVALAAMVSAVFSQTLTVQNRQRRTLVVRLLGLAINVALALTWLPQLGALGAARAVLVSELAVAACLALAANLPARWWRTMANRLARLAIAAGVLSAGLWWLAPWGFIGSAALALALYAAALFASRAISNRDWALIRRLPAAWRTASDLAQPSPERMG